MRISSDKFDSVIHLLLRGFLGGVFIYASIGKIIHPEMFAESIANYRILPAQMVNFMAVILPWIELVAGVCLILGLWLPGSLFVMNLLLFVFFGALLSACVRGLNIECGCFETSVDKMVAGSMAWYLIRDAVLLVIGITAFVRVLREEGRIS